MADNGKDQNVVNGNSRLTSPSDSVDILIPPESNEASGVSPLKGQHLIDNSASNATQPVLDVDKSKSGTSSVSLSPDFGKTRFTVTPCPSSEQSRSTTTSTTPSELSPPQTPKSVTFDITFPEIHPIPSSSQQGAKSPQKHFTIGEPPKSITPKKPVADPKALITPPSPASMSSNNDIELLPMNRTLTSSPTRRQLLDESFEIADQSNIPLLGNTDGDQPDNLRTPSSGVSGLTGTTTTTQSGGTPTRAAGECSQCILKTLYIYVAAVISFVVAFFLGATVVYCYYQFSGKLVCKEGRNGTLSQNSGILNLNGPRLTLALAQTALDAINENITSFPESKVTLDTTTVDSPDTTDPTTIEPMTNEPYADNETTATTTFFSETSAERNENRTITVGN